MNKALQITILICRQAFHARDEEVIYGLNSY